MPRPPSVPELRIQGGGRYPVMWLGGGSLVLSVELASASVCRPLRAWLWWTGAVLPIVCVLMAITMSSSPMYERSSRAPSDHD